MKDKRKKLNISSFGFSTILLAFVMICVVTFSALSYVTALSDYKLSKKVADKTKAYYIAEEVAYNKISSLEIILIDSYKNTTDSTSYFEDIKTKLDSLGNVKEVDGKIILSLEETISNNQKLFVELSLNDPYLSDKFFDCLCFKSIYDDEIIIDDTLNLID